MKKRRSSKTHFSKVLTSIMDERELTIRQVAKMAGVSPSTINDWQGGANPEDYFAVKRLAKALDMSFSFILTGEGDSTFPDRVPSLAEVFEDGGELFDGYAKITIQRLLPRGRRDKP